MIILLVVACVGIPVYATNNEMTVQPRNTSYTLYSWIRGELKTPVLTRPTRGQVTVNATLSGSKYVDVTIYDANTGSIVYPIKQMTPGERSILVWSIDTMSGVSDRIYIVFNNHSILTGQFVNGYISY